MWVCTLLRIQCLDVCFGGESSTGKEQSVRAITEVFQNMSLQKVSTLLQGGGRCIAPRFSLHKSYPFIQLCNTRMPSL